VLQFLLLNDEKLVLAYLVASALVVALDELTGDRVDELLAQAVAGLLVYLPEGDALACVNRGIERYRARD
jgi:hypothetical protein